MLEVPNTPLPSKNAQKLKKSKFITYFLIYFPVLILFSLIIMIYTTYFTQYIWILLTSSKYSKENFPFINTSNTNTGKNKGIVLFALSGISMLLLVISMIRTIMVNPGHFPDPTQLEIKIVMRNSTQRHKFNKKTPQKKQNEMNDLALENEAIISNKEEKNSIRKKEFLKSFGRTINNGPLTFYEYSNCNQRLIDYIDDTQNTLHLYLNNENNERPSINIDSKKLSKEPVKFPMKFQYSKKSEHRLVEEEEFNEIDTKIISNDDPTDLDFVFEHFKNIDLSKANLCNSCIRWKFERSHHCRQCGKCVLKMDHHCPWLANCIGFRNYKYFCLIHLYGSIGTFVIFITFWEVILYSAVFESTNLFLYSFFVFIYIADIGLMAFLLWLLSANFKLVFSGQTIIEQSDRDRFPSSKSVNIYDLGYYNNFKTVFGHNCLVWFLPIFPNYNGLGLIFETNENCLRR